MSVGKRIRELRQQNNLTQAELADKLFVTRQAVTKWENDKSMPGLDTINKLTELFKVSKEYLLTGEEKKEEAKPKREKVKHIYAPYIKVLLLSATLLILVIIIPIYNPVNGNVNINSDDSNLGFYITLDEKRLVSSLDELYKLDTPVYSTSPYDSLGNGYIKYFQDEHSYLDLAIPFNQYNILYTYIIYKENNTIKFKEDSSYSLDGLEAQVLIEGLGRNVLVRELIPLNKIEVGYVNTDHSFSKHEEIILNEDGLIKSSINGIIASLNNYFTLGDDVSYSVVLTNILGDKFSYNIYSNKTLELYLVPYSKRLYDQSFKINFKF